MAPLVKPAARAISSRDAAWMPRRANTSVAASIRVSLVSSRRRSGGNGVTGIGTSSAIDTPLTGRYVAVSSIRMGTGASELPPEVARWLRAAERTERLVTTLASELQAAEQTECAPQLAPQPLA